MVKDGVRFAAVRAQLAALDAAAAAPVADGGALLVRSLTDATVVVSAHTSFGALVGGTGGGAAAALEAAATKPAKTAAARGWDELHRRQVARQAEAMGRVRCGSRGRGGPIFDATAPCGGGQRRGRRSRRAGIRYRPLSTAGFVGAPGAHGPICKGCGPMSS